MISFCRQIQHEDAERIPAITPRVLFDFRTDPGGCCSHGSDQKLAFCLLFLLTTANIHNFPSSTELSAMHTSLEWVVMLPLNQAFNSVF